MSAKIEDVKYMRNKLKEIKMVNGSLKSNFKLFEECLSILSTISNEEIYELKDDVYNLLTCSDDFIRDEVVATLGFPNRLYLPEFRDTAYEIWLNDDNDMVRRTALSSWCGYYRESKNKKVLKELYNIINNNNLSIDIRVTAYSGIFSTVSFNHPSYDPVNDMDALLSCETNEEFNNLVNWDAIRDIMRQYAPEALKEQK